MMCRRQGKRRMDLVAEIKVCFRSGQNHHISDQQVIEITV